MGQPDVTVNVTVTIAGDETESSFEHSYAVAKVEPRSGVALPITTSAIQVGHSQFFS